jgi:hypothetical protein
MTDTEATFDLESYLSSFGRLDCGTPCRNRTLTLKPVGCPADSKPFKDEVRKVLRADDLIDPIFPTQMPADTYPLIVGPSFRWRKPSMAWEITALIRESHVVYDETDSSEDLGSLWWSRLHAAYLLNEIAPDDEVEIVLRTTDLEASSRNEPKDQMVRAAAGNQHQEHQRFGRGGREPSPDFLTKLLEEDDDVSNYSSFDRSKPSPVIGSASPARETLRACGRRLSARAWYEELLPIARQHFSFITNFQVLGFKLFSLCSAPTDTFAILDALKSEMRKAARTNILPRPNLHLTHPAVLQRIIELSESTAAQRLDLFSQLVTIKHPSEFRPTLGDRFVCGRHFGSAPSVSRRARHAFEHIIQLIAAGVLEFDIPEKTVRLTEGGWKVVEILRKCPDIREYQEKMVDQLLMHEEPASIGQAVEAWTLNYFKDLVVAAGDLGETL